MAFYLDSVLNCTRLLMRKVSGWIARHLIGAVLVSLPAVAVFAHVTCDMQLSIEVDFQNCHACKTSINDWIIAIIYILLYFIVSVWDNHVCSFDNCSCSSFCSQLTMFICCAVIIAIIHYCNFCQLSYWMRSALATFVGLVLLALLFISPCR